MIRGDDRGVSTLIGAVFLLGVLVILLSVNQAVVVPDQNRGLEFNHNREVRDQMSMLRNALVSSVGGAETRSISLRLGMRYPPRVVAVNPGPATGQIRTVGIDDGDVAFGVENATALDDEADDFWNGARRNYSTGTLAYRPDYNEYGGAPETVYGNSLLYDEFGERRLVRAEQALLDGDRLSLVALNGSLGRTSSESTTVDVRPISASPRTVAVENESAGSNVTLTLPTRLDRSEWEDVLAEERADGTVVDVDTETVAGSPLDAVVIELAPGTYELQMAKAGIGSRTTGTEAAYLTDVSGDGASVPESGTQRFVVEARDRFNNPVEGVTVAAAANGTGSLRGAGETWAANGTSDEEGRVTFTYEAPENIDGQPEAVRVDATRDTRAEPGDASFDTGTPENVTFDLAVRNTDGSGLGGGGSGGAQFDVGIDSADGSIVQGETFAVDAIVANTGSESGNTVVSLDFGGTNVDGNATSSLDAGESTTVRLTHDDTNSLSGAYSYTVRTDDDQESGSVTVREPDGPHFATLIESTNAPIVEGETLEVTTVVENVGNETDTQTVTLTAGGSVVDSRSVNDLSPGSRSRITLTYDSSVGDRGDLDVIAESDDDGDRRTVTVERGTPYFDVAIADTNEPIAPGDRLEVTADVTNTGDVTAQQRVALDFRADGSTNDRQFVTLDPGESTQITLDYGTPSTLAAGDYDVEVASENTTAGDTVVLEDRDPYFDVFVTDTNAPVGAGERLDVTVEIKNTGDAAAEQKVTLDFLDDGSVEDREFVALDPGEETTATLSHTTDEGLGAGEYDLAVASANTTDTATVEIDSPPYFDVRDVTSPSSVVEGETVTVDAEIENTGGAGTETVELEIESVGTVSTQVSLAAGETKTVTLSLDTRDGDAGDRNLIVRSEDDAFTSNSIDILRDPEFTVDLPDSGDMPPVSETETLDVTVSVSNVGDVEGTKDVELDFDGTTVDSVPVTLASGSDGQVTLSYETQKGDAGENVPITARTEDDDDSATVTVRPLGWINGTTFDPETADEKRIEGVTVELLDGDDDVVETQTTDADGSYAFDVPRGDYTVRFDGGSVGYGSYQEDVSLTAGGEQVVDADLQAYTVFATSPNGIGNKGTINSEAEVNRVNGGTVDISVYIDDAGNNKGYDVKTVTIDGETHTLTEDAADRIANEEQVDLFSESNYEGIVNGDLDGYNGAIPEGAGSTVSNYGDEGLSLAVALKS